MRALAKGFVAAGIQPGDKIGLMAKTSYEWTLIDFAAWLDGPAATGTNLFSWRVFNAANAEVASGNATAFRFMPAAAGVFRVEFTLLDSTAQVLASASSTP